MTSQYGAYAFRAGLERLHASVRMHTPIRLSSHIHARTHARTHRPISNTCCFSTVAMIRERASVLRYTYIAPLVNLLSSRIFLHPPPPNKASCTSPMSSQSGVHNLRP